jgi:hypothetical protein
MCSDYSSQYPQKYITVSNNQTLIAHYNTWDGSHDYLSSSLEEESLPGIYLANFALAHSLHVDLAARDEYFRKQSETVQFWRVFAARNKALGRKTDVKVNY